jgi:hypothetical protein
MANTQGGDVVELDAADASITTATVTIQAMKVGKRQMTQSIFRQLPEERIVDDENIVLTGTPWGWVNYHWSGVDHRAKHFIFQRGNGLYRCPFLMRVSASFFEEARQPFGYAEIIDGLKVLTEAHHRARILEGWRPEKNENDRYSYANDSNSKWESEYKVDGIPGFQTFKVTKLPRSLDLLGSELDADASADTLERRKRHVLELKEELTSEIKGRIGSVATAKEIHARLTPQYERARAYCRRWDALMDELRQIGQVFIAV